MTTVAEGLVHVLRELGVRQVWGVVGDALNPITDAIRQEPEIEWIGVRHEEAGAFAASAQAQLSGTLGVCMGTVGPGAIHLLNGLYDAAKSHAPVLAVCGQVPRAEMGSDYFQEVDNDLLFTDVARFRFTLTSPEQAPRVIAQAVQAAYEGPGVAVLSIPGDVGSLELPAPVRVPRHVLTPPRTAPDPAAVSAAADLLERASTVTLLVGMGAREAREDVLALAERLAAPMVLTLKAKEGLEHDNPYQIGQSGLIGNTATKKAFDDTDVLLMLGTDFPYPDWLPEKALTIQVDRAATHLGRRTPLELGVVSDVGLFVKELLPRVRQKTDRSHLDDAVAAYAQWVERQSALTRPDTDATGIVGRVRAVFDNPDDRIRPEAVAAAVDRLAAEDAIFTADTGMSAVWLARFVTFRGSRRLVGSMNLGSMANAMPHALGAQALDRSRQVIAFCGDGGLTMLLGDIITAVSYDLPVTLVCFNNGRLGMVKLEQEQGGLPEFGTVLTNPDLAAVAEACGLRGIRVTDPEALEGAVAEALAHPGPVLLDVVTNPDEIALPPKTTPGQAWGFAVAKSKETLLSRGDT
ncbi:MAG: thiamine pyrophosphate protein binding domain protein [Frankiales bacterium]|nr:thiamine pyrophosphate protein binding domain protein [Frankiales bacterium]